nr:response regulator transcription factor [Micromonospora sp. DSM 115978]
MIRVAAVDDDRMLLDGLRSWLRDVPELHLAATAGTVDGLLCEAPEAVDVVLLDLVLRDRSDPAENVRRLRAVGHRVLVLSVWNQLDQVVATFAAGASGYLTKDHNLPVLAEAVREVAGGGVAFSSELAHACLRDSRPASPSLSPRERGVLLAYASGMTLKAAARHLGIKPETARTYLDRVKAKYQGLGRPAYTKLDLAERVREDGLDRAARAP